MKVTQPGSLAFIGTRLISAGWRYQLEDGESYPSIDSPECRAAVLIATLDYIARTNGASLLEDVEPVTFEIERAALDAIAVARWPAHR